MSSDAKVARRYARALYDLAVESSQLDEVAAALSSITDLFAIGDPSVCNLLASPTFSLAERHAILERVLPPVPALLHAFLLLVLDRHRIGLLPSIRTAWCTLSDHDACRAQASVVAARPLAPEAVTDIRMALGHLTGGAVEVAARTDPSLLGGIVVQMGDTVWDASLRSRLEAMERTLLSTHPAGTRA
jgi:F-type H+-transporting ATPase subunit delta